MTTQGEHIKRVKDFTRHPYAWPGGYPCYAITIAANELNQLMGINQDIPICAWEGAYYGSIQRKMESR